MIFRRVLTAALTCRSRRPAHSMEPPSPTSTVGESGAVTPAYRCTKAAHSGTLRPRLLARSAACPHISFCPINSWGEPVPEVLVSLPSPPQRQPYFSSPSRYHRGIDDH